MKRPVTTSPPPAPAPPPSTAAVVADAKTPTSAAQPRTPGKNERILALDVLRGIAILGTLASNIWIFAAVAGTPPEDGWGKWFADASHWLPNGKFLGLLTIMFGIGLEIQRQSALRNGRKWPGKYPIRAGLLALDGLLNFVLVVQFDVLRAYAVVGLLVAFLLLLNERVQWWLIGLFFTAHTTLMVTVGMAGPLKGDDDEALGGEEIIKVAPGKVDEEFLNEMGDMSYWDSVREALRGFGDYHSPGSEFFVILIMGLGMFLLGAKLYRIGIFAAEKRRLRYWLIGLGFGVALPLDYYLGMAPGVPGELSDMSRYGTSGIVALAILCLVAEFYLRRPHVGFVGRRLAEVGRMALSCYLLQNIIGVIGQYTFLKSEALMPYSNTAITYAAFAVVSLILVVFAHLWLRKFSRGPFELVWNWSYRKIARE